MNYLSITLPYTSTTMLFINTVTDVIKCQRDHDFGVLGRLKHILKIILASRYYRCIELYCMGWVYKMEDRDDGVLG